MLYRCLKCEHEVGGGCTPTVMCGMFPLGLLAVSTLGWNVCLLIGRLILLPAPPEPVEIPWWWWPIGCVGSIVLNIGTAWCLYFALVTIERFRVRRSACPNCCGREWSDGYTSGFGL